MWITPKSHFKSHFYNVWYNVWKIWRNVKDVWSHVWFQVWSHMWFFITNVNHTKITGFHTSNQTSAIGDCMCEKCFKEVYETCETSHLNFLLSVISCMITLTKVWLLWITHLFTLKSDLPVAMSTTTMY